MTIESNELLRYDALGLSALIRDGEVTAGEVLDATLARVEALDDTLHAIIDLDAERVRSQLDSVTPEAPFAGIPTVAKDLVDVEGMRRTDGSRLRAEHRSPASPDLIRQLESAGLLIVGKSNTPEFATLPITSNELRGSTANPWNLEYSAGGSSGGSAAAVAAGYMPIAHGTDGGGSNRIPASTCGVFGMKPSRGRQASGELDGSHTVLKTHQALSRSVRDSAALAAATENRIDNPYPLMGRVTEPLRDGCRVGCTLVDVCGTAPDPAVVAAISATAEVLADLGHEVVEVPQPIDGEPFYDAVWSLNFRTVRGMRESVEAAIGRPLEGTGLVTRCTYEMMEIADRYDVAAFERAEQYRQDLTADLTLHFFDDIDVWLTPVQPFAAVAIDAFDPAAPFDRLKSERHLSNCPIANMTGAPSMSVPLWFDTPTGVPIGSMFTAAPGADALLYRLALQLELARPWLDRWAPHSASFVT